MAIICSKCGNQLPDGSVFCDNCGQPVQMVGKNKAKDMPSQGSQNKSPLIPILIAAIAVLLIGVGVGAFYLLQVYSGGELLAKEEEGSDGNDNNSPLNVFAKGPDVTETDPSKVDWDKRDEATLGTIKEATEEAPMAKDFMVGTWLKCYENISRDPSLLQDLSDDKTQWRTNTGFRISFSDDGTYIASKWFLDKPDSKLTYSGKYDYIDDENYEKNKVSTYLITIDTTIDNYHQDPGAPEISEERLKEGRYTVNVTTTSKLEDELLLETSGNWYNEGDAGNYCRKLSNDYHPELFDTSDMQANALSEYEKNKKGTKKEDTEDETLVAKNETEDKTLSTKNEKEDETLVAKNETKDENPAEKKDSEKSNKEETDSTLATPWNKKEEASTKDDSLNKESSAGNKDTNEKSSDSKKDDAQTEDTTNWNTHNGELSDWKWQSDDNSEENGQKTDTSKENGKTDATPKDNGNTDATPKENVQSETTPKDNGQTDALPKEDTQKSDTLNNGGPSSDSSNSSGPSTEKSQGPSGDSSGSGNASAEYTPVTNAVSGGKFDTLQSGETVYYLANGTQAQDVWVVEMNKYYYIGYDQCLMYNNYASDGYYVGADGAWDKYIPRLTTTDKLMTGDYVYENGYDSVKWNIVMSPNGGYDGTAEKVYSFGYSESYGIIYKGGSCYMLESDSMKGMGPQLTVLNGGERFIITEFGYSDRFIYKR